jgi:hypothetical protein
MKTALYCLCPLPAVCSFLGSLWPNGTIGGVYGPNNWWFGGDVWAIVLSALLTFSGLIMMFLSPRGKISIGIVVATIIAAIPGILPFLSTRTD